MTIRIEIKSDVGEILSQMGHWRELHAQCGVSPFSSAEWIEAWFAAWPDPKSKPAFGFAWDQNELVAGLPLGLGRKKTSKFGPAVATLHPLCDEKSGYHEMLFRNGYETLAKDMILAYRNALNWAVLDLHPIQVDASSEAILGAAHWAFETTRVRDEITSAVADLTGGWDAYHATRSREFRKSLRSSERKLEKIDHEYTVTTTLDALGAEKVEDAIALSGRCWKSQIGTDLVSDPNLGNFIRSLFKTMGPAQSASLHLLKIEDVPAASLVMLSCKDQSFALINDFDERFRNLSLGRVLLMRGMKDAADRGMTRVDFLRATPFTTRFATDEMTLVRAKFTRRFSLTNALLGTEDLLRPLGQSTRRSKQLVQRKRAGNKTKVIEQLNKKEG